LIRPKLNLIRAGFLAIREGPASEPAAAAKRVVPQFGTLKGLVTCFEPIWYYARPHPPKALGLLWRALDLTGLEFQGAGPDTNFPNRGARARGGDVHGEPDAPDANDALRRAPNAIHGGLRHPCARLDGLWVTPPPPLSPQPLQARVLSFWGFCGFAPRNAIFCRVASLATAIGGTVHGLLEMMALPPAPASMSSGSTLNPKP